MFLQTFIITMSMLSIPSVPIITNTIIPTTTETFETPPRTIEMISSLSAVTNLATTTELSSSSSTKTTALSTSQSTTLTTFSRYSPYNRPCIDPKGRPGWLCDDHITCIWLAAVCGGKPTCLDGSDETAGCSEDPRYCPFLPNKPGWRCDSGECINKFSVCDSIPECQDGSDEEAGCTTMDLVPCPTDNNTLTERWAANHDCRECWAYKSNWRCDDGRCTKKWLVCDGRPGDCLDGSDEWEGCKSVYKSTFSTSNNNRSCLSNLGEFGWLCDDSTTCIWLAYVCNGYLHCPDGSDEVAGCSEDPRYCQFETGEPGWRCDNGECILKARVCGGTPDCQDKSDERAGCDAMDLVPCPTDSNTLTERWAANVDCRRCWDSANYWRCDNGRCTKRTAVCNGRPGGCLDGSDEWQGCELMTCKNDSSITTAAMFVDEDCRKCHNEDYWRCNNGDCIYKAFLCNGIEECPSGEDEIIGCSNLVDCKVDGVVVQTEPQHKQSGHCRSCFHTKYWRCNSGQCIHERLVCDNVLFGRWDCQDGSDEEPGSGCPINVTCVADKTVVTTPHFFNGTLEKCLSCSGKSKGKVANNFKRCKNGQCKHKVRFCNGHRDCSDGSDEIGCNIFTYLDTQKAVILSLSLVAITAYLYIKFTNFHSFNLTSCPKYYPKKTPKLYKDIKKYCNVLESDSDNNEDRLRKFHKSIRKKRNGLRKLLVAITSLFEEPQMCHKNCTKVLNLEREFHENDNETLMYIRKTAGSNEYTEKFANALESPGFISKLSFSSTKQLEYVSFKIGNFAHLIKALSKMVLFYFDIIKDVVLFFKLWNIVSHLEDVNILHQVLVYISCVLIFFAQMLIGVYLVIKLGKPHKKLPSSLFALVLFFLFLISPLIPIVLVVKDSLLNSETEEKKYEMKNNKRKGLTKFFTFVSLTNKEAIETKRLFSFHKITNSILESLPQLVIYCIFCLTYYYDNSLISIFFTNSSISNTIMFACSIPLSLLSVVSGISAYSSVDGKSHYIKKMSYLFQILSRICAILSFISPLYAVYFTYLKTSLERFILLHADPIDYYGVLYFFTSSLISITYPHIVFLFLILSIIFALHGIFIYFYSYKNIPGFSDAALFHKLTHTLVNTFIVLPWRPSGQEDQRRRSQEHQNYHHAMAVTNILIIILSSIGREYNHMDHIIPGKGTKLHLEWIHHIVSVFLPSNLPLLEQLFPYHYPIGLLLNVMTHIPWLLLVLLLQGISVFTMSIYYKKFHPWKIIINTANVNKTTIVDEFFSTRNEVLEEESEIEWVDENLMESDTDTDEDEIDVIADKIEEKEGTETAKEDASAQNEPIVQQFLMRHRLEQDRSILMKSLATQQKKKEHSRREFFSEMRRMKSNDQKASGNSFLTKSNRIKIQVQVHQTETKKEVEFINDIEEPYKHKEDTHRGDSKSAGKALDFVNIIIKDKKSSEEDHHSNQDFCREILHDMIDKALDCEDVPHVEYFMEEVQNNNQHLCKEIILELVGDAVANAYL